MIKTLNKLNAVWKMAIPVLAYSFGLSNGFPAPIETINASIAWRKKGKIRIAQATPITLNKEWIRADRFACTLPTVEANSAVIVVPIFSRSEERRVGKECRFLRSTDE